MGYTLETKINPTYRREFLEEIQKMFLQEATVVEEFSNRLVFNVPKDCIKSLANVFERLENGNFTIQNSNNKLKII